MTCAVIWDGERMMCVCNGRLGGSFNSGTDQASSNRWVPEFGPCPWPCWARQEYRHVGGMHLFYCRLMIRDSALYADHVNARHRFTWVGTRVGARVGAGVGVCACKQQEAWDRGPWPRSAVGHIGRVGCTRL